MKNLIFVFMFFYASCHMTNAQRQRGSNTRSTTVPRRDRPIIFPSTPKLTLEDEIRSAMIHHRSLTNVSDILKALGVSIPNQDDLLSRHPTRQFAAPAVCEPELRTVPVNSENTIDQYFIPFCVRVKRCGGCCPTGFECIPKKVKSTPVRGAKVRRSRRSEAGLKGEYVTMHVEEHEECTCKCKVQASHCNPALHDYDASDCKCVCRNTDKLAECASSPLPKLWSPDDCRCKCKSVSHCSTGQVFSHETCSCVADV